LGSVLMLFCGRLLTPLLLVSSLPSTAALSMTGRALTGGPRPAVALAGVGPRPPSSAALAPSSIGSFETYLARAAATSCVLRAGSDVVGQFMHLSATTRSEIHLPHVAAMGTVGLLMSGVVGSTWLAIVEQHLSDSPSRTGSSSGELVGTSSGSSPQATAARKAAADFLIYAPLANSAYLLAVPFLTTIYAHLAQDFASTVDLTGTLAHSLQNLHERFGSAMRLELSMFVPFNLFSFCVIPAELRPQAAALMSAGFTVCLSTMC